MATWMGAQEWSTARHGPGLQPKRCHAFMGPMGCITCYVLLGNQQFGFRWHGLVRGSIGCEQNGNRTTLMDAYKLLGLIYFCNIM